MKKVLLFKLFILLALDIFSQNPRTKFSLSDYGVTIRPDKRVMTVMAALEISGLKAPLNKQGENFRKALRFELKDINPTLRQKINAFVNRYKKKHKNVSASELTAPFISMAYSLSKTPSLEAPGHSADMPDDLLEVLDFATLVQEFYKMPEIKSIIDVYFKKYSEAGRMLSSSAIEMVRDILNYLNTSPQLIYVERVRVDESQPDKKKIIETRIQQRTFNIVPEMLAPKNTVNFLNIRDSYYAVVSPETNLRSSEVRRAYLQFVLDPLVLKNAKNISKHNSEIRKLLDERRKYDASISPDVFLAVSRSLVAAVDIREEEYRKVRIATLQARNKIDTLKTEAEKKAVVKELQRYKNDLADNAALRLSERYESGAVLAFYFARKMREIEDSGFDIANSLNDWIVSLNPLQEKNYLKEFAEAKNRAYERKLAGRVMENNFAKNPFTERLFEIEKLIEAKKYPEAEKQLEDLLSENPNQARILYALGQVVNLSAGELNDPNEIKKRLEMAITHYSNAIRSVTPITKNTPIADIAWVSRSYFALGRIYEFYEQNEYALKIYETVLKVGWVRGGAYEDALKARQKLMIRLSR